VLEAYGEGRWDEEDDDDVVHIVHIKMFVPLIVEISLKMCGRTRQTDRCQEMHLERPIVSRKVFQTSQASYPLIARSSSLFFCRRLIQQTAHAYARTTNGKQTDTPKQVKRTIPKNRQHWRRIEPNELCKKKLQQFDGRPPPFWSSNMLKSNQSDDISASTCSHLPYTPTWLILLIFKAIVMHRALSSIHHMH